MWWWLHKSVHVMKLHRTVHAYTDECKAGKIWKSSVDCANFNFLVLVLYYNDAGCYQWEELCEEYSGPTCTWFFFCFCFFFCNFQWIYNYFKIKGLKNLDKIGVPTFFTTVLHHLMFESCEGKDKEGLVKNKVKFCLGKWHDWLINWKVWLLQP